MSSRRARNWRHFRRAVFVLALLSALGLLLVPNFIRCHCCGQLTACKSNLKNIGTALEMYSTDHAEKYPRSLAQLVPLYLKNVPDCPTAGFVTYRATFGRNAPTNPNGYDDFYLVECMGANHVEVSVPVDKPAYNGVDGLIER